MRPLSLLPFFVLTSCGSPPPPEPVEPEQLARANDLPKEAFTEKLATCEDTDQTARALFRVISSTMSAQSNPEMESYRVSPYGEGEVFAITVEFEPGDPGVTSRNVDYIALRADCAWAYFDTAYDQ